MVVMLQDPLENLAAEWGDHLRGTAAPGMQEIGRESPQESSRGLWAKLQASHEYWGSNDMTTMSKSRLLIWILRIIRYVMVIFPKWSLPYAEWSSLDGLWVHIMCGSCG